MYVQTKDAYICLFFMQKKLVLTMESTIYLTVNVLTIIYKVMKK